MSETLFTEAAVRLARPFDDAVGEDVCVERAVDFLLVSWQGPSGLVGTTVPPRFAARHTTSGGTVAARWRSVSAAIPAWHERLRGVEFRARDAFRLLLQCPDRSGTVVYCDPPYLGETRTTARYLHDFEEKPPASLTPEELKKWKDPHERLANLLRTFRHTRVLVSYYDAPRLETLYPGWRKVTLTAARTLGHSTAGPGPDDVAPEVVLINQP